MHRALLAFCPTVVEAGHTGGVRLAAKGCSVVGNERQNTALAGACRALWLATLSLMAAFMENAAPGHRYLLARRISRNFDTLCRQDCFNTADRRAFECLARRWQDQADRLAPAEVPSSVAGASVGSLLNGLFTFRR